MRKHPQGYALAFAIVLCISVTASAQTPQPSEAAKAPSSFDPHDLSGVWFDDHPRLIRVQERYWAYTFSQEAPSMTPWAQAQFDAAKASFGPHAHSLMETTDPQIVGATLDDPVKQVNLNLLTGLVLGSPEFQKR